MHSPIDLVGRRPRGRFERSARIASASEALAHQMELGHIAREPSEPLAHVMFGALTEGGLIIAHSDNKRSARKVMGAATLRQFNRLRVRAGGGKNA